VLHEEIEESFRKLRTDTFRLYYLHRVDPETPIETSLTAIKDYVDRGKILAVGISEVGIEQIERARKVLPIAVVQNHYNLGERKYDDVVDYCEREEIVFVPFFPLRAQPVAAMAKIARRHRATTRQVMLAWLLRRSPVMHPIPGTLSLEHLKENQAAGRIDLSDEEFESLR
jgi:aryl-alcohol dehydrogenase-like predicted oxidoreductase